MADASALDAYLAAQRERHLEELLALLRIPSISTLPEHRADVAACAAWVAQRLRRAGLEHVALLEAGGNPVAYGDWLHAGPEAPTVLVYGHYDVQPVDPLELWTSPPFAPEIRDGKVFARGASDCKGRILGYIQSLEAVLAVYGRLPVNVRVMVEGEEELRADNLARLLEQQRELLAADYALISDSSMLAAGTPSVLIGLRGMAAIEITLRAAASDLHSGLYGGTVPNALHALVTLLGTLHSPDDGHIPVEGFYDAVRPITPEQRAAWAQLPFDEAGYRAELGLAQLFGETGFSPRERTWARPTLELNGVWGGFRGEGIKTVIPCEAHAKISCRLVPDQDPVQILRLLRRHLEAHTPPGTKLSIDFEMAGAWPVLTEPEHPGVKAALESLREGFGCEPVAVRGGASVPVVALFKQTLGLDSVILGFGLPTDQIHAPNEHYRLSQFDGALRTLVRLWPRLAATPAR